MRKPGILILWVLWTVFSVNAGVRAHAAVPCPEQSESLPAELHETLTQAEDIARKGGYEQAADFLFAYLEKQTDRTQAYPYYHLGYFRHHTGQAEAAIAALSLSVKKNPCFTEAWQLLATTHHESCHMKHAARAMAHAAALSEEADMHYQSAVLWIKAGRHKKAVELLEPLLESRKPAPDWFVAMANARQQLKQPDQAAAAMTEAAKLSGEADHQIPGGPVVAGSQKTQNGPAPGAAFGAKHISPFRMAGGVRQRSPGPREESGDGPGHGARRPHE